MSEYSPQILLMICDKCTGMTAKLMPETTVRFSELRVLPVSCPAQVDSFAIIKLLKKSVDGVIVACPRDACCCPDNKKLLKRREIVKDILPVFDLHREQFQIASISPLAARELNVLIEQMKEFLKTLRHETEEFSFIEDSEVAGNKLKINKLKWVN
ncbi:MAG: hydrogenase iron-sulfur subunit [Thermincola sp.]|jgi:coenzyme F420-reducing hydrogenase delta subunit|nr:hydrogenase iron-sulfur subunit [Thermincola sp.]MDT3704648.1 hydrogenase iron-sulfur subunit [Thermincola sp.]